MILNRLDYVTRLAVAVIPLIFFHCQQHLFVKNFVFMMNQLTLSLCCVCCLVSHWLICVWKWLNYSVVQKPFVMWILQSKEYYIYFYIFWELLWQMFFAIIKTKLKHFCGVREMCFQNNFLIPLGHFMYTMIEPECK